MDSEVKENESKKAPLHDVESKRNSDGEKSDEDSEAKMEDEEDDGNDRKKSRKLRESSTTLQAKWDEMFNRLAIFRRKHGHCLGTVIGG